MLGLLFLAIALFVHIDASYSDIDHQVQILACKLP